MNHPLLVVLPYHAGDIDLARKLVEWIAELGSCEPHSLLLCADAAAPRDKIVELMELARPHFLKVQTMLVTVPAPSEGKTVWPPNVMFLNAARQVRECYKFDFLWLEPDAIPLHAGWLDDISEAYGECPLRFMGSIIEQEGQVGLPPKYLNGVAVYPNNAFDVFDKIASVKDSSQAFDIGSASVVVARSANTPLIQHYYGTKELPPVFVEAPTPDAPKNHVTLAFISNRAAIFHRSKDGKLIDLLKSKRVVGSKEEPENAENLEVQKVLEPGPEKSQETTEKPQATITQTQPPTGAGRSGVNKRTPAAV